MHQTPPIASFPKAALFVSLLLAGVMAGCVDDGAKDCVDGACTQTAKPGDAFLTNATRARGDFPDCTGAFLGTEIPNTLVQGHLPRAFTSGGQTSSTATILIHAFDCPRATIADLTAEPFRMVMTGVFARPVNESWTPLVVGHYAFEVFVDDPAVATELGAWGLPAINATIDINQRLPGPVSQDEWTIQAGDRSYVFPITEIEGQGGGAGAGGLALWAGVDQFHRIDRNTTAFATIGGIGIEAVEMDGNAALGAITGTGVHSFRTQPYHVFQDEWRPYPSAFSI